MKTYEQGRLDQFIRMKKERPLDPVYWDAHEERNLREALRADGVPEHVPPDRHVTHGDVRKCIEGDHSECTNLPEHAPEPDANEKL